MIDKGKVHRFGRVEKSISKKKNQSKLCLFLPQGWGVICLRKEFHYKNGRKKRVCLRTFVASRKLQSASQKLTFLPRSSKIEDQFAFIL